MLSDLVISTAAGSSISWLYNASRILHRDIARTPDDTRWWRLVRLIHADLGLPLQAAAKIADATLNGLSPTKVRLNATVDGSIAIQLDMDRFLSSTSAALSAARNFSVPAPRGRPPKTPRQAPNGVASIPEGTKIPTVRLGAFEAHGADVAIVVKSTVERAEAVAKDIRAAGRKALVIKADVSNEADTNRVAEEVVAAWGRIDILVASAGTNIAGDRRNFKITTMDDLALMADLLRVARHSVDSGEGEP